MENKTKIKLSIIGVVIGVLIVASPLILPTGSFWVYACGYTIGMISAVIYALSKARD